MEKTDFYPTIFQRKSVRRYDLTPLDDNTLAEISDYMDNLEPMYPDIKIELKISGPDEVKRRFMRKAPHYIAVFSENKDGYLTNVGFMVQQMDLFLSGNGLGTCWQGIPQPTKDLLESSGLEFIIFMPFGKPDEPLHRSSASEFKRKSLQKISSVTGAEDLLEAARMAPSAGNGQPWFFTGDESLIHAYCNKPGIVRGLIGKKYPPIDVGIAIYHLKAAAEHFGKKAEVVFEKPAEESPGGYDYVASLRLIEF